MSEGDEKKRDPLFLFLSNDSNISNNYNSSPVIIDGNTFYKLLGMYENAKADIEDE